MGLPLILIGGGGHCKSVIDAALEAGRDIAGIIDVEAKVGTDVLGFPIISTEDHLPEFVGDYEFLVTVGSLADPSVRIRIFTHIKECGGALATIVAPTAHVSRFAEIGEGTVVLNGACVNAAAHVGDNVIINSLANIEHDVVIGNNCHVSTCASVNGMSVLADNVFVGSQAVIGQCVNICSDVAIGAGSVVLRDICDPGVYVGNPAKRIK